VYDMYPWGDRADSGSAEPRHSGLRHSGLRHSGLRHSGLRHSGLGRLPADESAAAIRAVQVALDRRDNGGDAIAVAGQATVGVTRQ